VVKMLALHSIQKLINSGESDFQNNLADSPEFFVITEISVLAIFKNNIIPSLY
jgi:hypothetical protein